MLAVLIASLLLVAIAYAVMLAFEAKHAQVTEEDNGGASAMSNGSSASAAPAPAASTQEPSRPGSLFGSTPSP